MSPEALTRETRAASWRVFALVFLSTAYFFQSTGHNEAVRLDQMRSLAEHREIWIDRYAYNSADVVPVQGHTYPGKAPGTSLLGVLPWVALRGFFRLLQFTEGQQLILVVASITLLMAALPSAVTSLLMLRFLARTGFPGDQATLIATGYGLGTIAFPWGTVLFGHQLSASLAFSAFYLIWSSRFAEGRRSLVSRIGAGVLLGFLPVVEHPGAIASGLIGLYALETLGWRRSLPIVAGGVIGLLPLPLYNLAAFGNPLMTAYSFFAKEGSPFPAHREGLVGVSWPRLEVLREITFKAQRGLFYANPWLCAVFAAPFFLRRFRECRREHVLCGAMVIAFLAFNAGYGHSIVYWGGGYSIGPRHFLIALPFLVLLAGLPLTSSRVAPVLTAIIAACSLLMLTVTSVDPRFPYEPNEPFLGFYFPLVARGLFSTNTSGSFDDTPFLRSVGASNIGRVMGLPKDLELLPLVLLWGVAVFLIFKSRSRATLIGRGVFLAALALPGLGPAMPRLTAPSEARPGFCESMTAGRAWPHFSHHALPAGHPHMDPQAYSSEYSGRLVPRRAGWHIFQIETTGEAALYVDGTRRAAIEGTGVGLRSSTSTVYLSSQSHEIIVRSMMKGEDPQKLIMLVAFRNGSFEPLGEAVTANACPSPGFSK